MNRNLCAHDAAGDLDRPIRDCFVGIHVGLRAAASLPNAQMEMLVKLAFDNFIARLYDKLQFVARQLAKIVVNQRASFLEDAETPNHLARHYVIANREMN